VDSCRKVCGAPMKGLAVGIERLSEWNRTFDHETATSWPSRNMRATVAPRRPPRPRFDRAVSRRDGKEGRRGRSRELWPRRHRPRRSHRLANSTYLETSIETSFVPAAAKRRKRTGPELGFTSRCTIPGGTVTKLAGLTGNVLRPPRPK
jgi:hypothetical protein